MKYKVTIERTIVQRVVVPVEADSDDEAISIVEGKVQHDIDNGDADQYEWELENDTCESVLEEEDE